MIWPVVVGFGQHNRVCYKAVTISEAQGYLASDIVGWRGSSQEKTLYNRCSYLPTQYTFSSSSQKWSFDLVERGNMPSWDKTTLPSCHWKQEKEPDSWMKVPALPLTSYVMCSHVNHCTRTTQPLWASISLWLNIVIISQVYFEN